VGTLKLIFNTNVCQPTIDFPVTALELDAPNDKFRESVKVHARAPTRLGSRVSKFARSEILLTLERSAVVPAVFEPIVQIQPMIVMQIEILTKACGEVLLGASRSWPPAPIFFCLIFNL
jgi:hypothetical protein